MPPLHLDHLSGVGASSNGESMRETAPDAAQRAGDVSSTARADDVDAPAESVLIRVRDGIGLAQLLGLGLGAALRRDGSTKGSSNPKAGATTRGAPRTDSSSRRSTASSKAAAAVVIGVVLPAAAGKVVAKERRAWRRPATGGARVFASEAVGPEPVSPKVSCFGAVLPETRAAMAAAPPPSTREGEEDERGGGCWTSVAGALRGLCCSCSSEPREGDLGASESDSRATTPDRPTAAVLSAPMLGDVKRLASRRWTETMAAEGRSSV